VDFRVTKGNAILPEFLRVLDENQIKVLTAEVKRPTLDDVFLGLTGRSLRESERVDEGLSTTETRSA
jgi:ABC-2 type transport system ATP-binding protein